jgi:hypothetical protein
MSAGSEKSDPRLIVESFYGALTSGDASVLERVIDENFAPDAQLVRPGSLPGGGTVAGRERIKRMMTAVAADERGPLNVRHMCVARVLECAGEDHDDLGVELHFSWQGTPTSAFEWWVLRDLQVTEIRAYYWDTAMMLGTR